MRRALWFRSIATLLAFWSPLISGEPGLLQPCPMHGAGPAVAAALLGTHAPAAATSAHTTASSHSHHAGAAHRAPASGHSHNDCTCVDCCAVSVAAVLPSLAPTVEIGAADYRVAGSVPSGGLPARPAPHYARPYTTGPPRA